MKFRVHTTTFTGRIPFLFAILAGLSLISCDDSPNLPITPQIEFVDVEYWEMEFTEPDSINLTISFKDGDGDLGLEVFEVFPPYNSAFFFVDENGDPVTLGHRGNGPPYDTLPPYQDPFLCTNYVVNPTIQGEVFNDTLYIQPNPNHFNIFVDFMVRQNDGTFERFPWESFLGLPDCGDSFNARFSRQDIGTAGREGQPIEGTLTYRMTSLAFPFPYPSGLRNATFKFRVWMLDRALNQSNVVESPEFTLNDIKVN